MDTIQITVGDFLKNAGIVGMRYILETAKAREGIDYGITEDDQTLWLTYEFASNADWTDLYFRTFVNMCSDDTAYFQCLDKINHILDVLRENQEYDYKDDLKYINDKLLSKSLRSGFENIRERIAKPEIYELLQKKKLNDSMSTEELSLRLSDLKEFLAQPLCKETFCMKGIIYNRINRFWEGKSFLLRANSSKDMRDVFESDFARPLYEHIIKNHSKAEEMCIDCGGLMGSNEQKKEKTSIAFMKEMADDLSRKKSAFWNCKVDAFLCPVCTFLYALSPLGFQYVGDSFLFVNTNYGISDLWRNNESEKTVSFKSEQGQGELYRQWSARVFNMLMEEKTRELKNVQIIIRGKADSERYVMNVIGKDVLEIVSDSVVKSRLVKLAEHPITKTGNNYWDVYENVMMNIIQYHSQYPTINKLLKNSIVKNSIDTAALVSRASLVYDIQSRIESYRRKHNTGGELMEISKAKHIKNKAFELRKTLLEAKGVKDNTDDASLRGMVYQLLNALAVKNTEHFMDIIMRVYCSTKQQVPDEFIEMLQNTDVFQEYGYAFVLGLQGSHYEKINN